MSLEEEINKVLVWGPREVPQPRGSLMTVVTVFEFDFLRNDDWIEEFLSCKKQVPSEECTKKIVALIEDQKGEALLSSFKWIRAVAKEIQ